MSRKGSVGESSSAPEQPPLHKVLLEGEEWCYKGLVGTCWIFYIYGLRGKINSFLFTSLEFSLQSDIQVPQVAFG